ncbi:methionyl-tRNA formyltransferase [Candidatus Photodesmus katoptron]|uniref:Methionyl-tRNA formyltransferase n=1 Tax=Candidatus Photodesmus katoptron Akat1 TaxID=1236703 RepID=S3DZT7_9GAMM|nr:methionyl-tRNA formyltransferase [Candidatus Photodesmus katoptron]EPE37481.1 methionyl-tRNA formyltransferase [Candidatus Photodesmus katoptron Akat1]KEY90310.1 methionyl-tRNA formyltransferase [Candidatus Photodesmus katoptron]
MIQPLKIIFAGTPTFATHHLISLLSSENKIIAVYTKPDRPSGRGQKITINPIKNIALKHNIPVYQPEDFKSEQNRKQIISLNADLIVVVAYGLLLPKVILDSPKFGCINVHSSILPLWRGAAPIQRSILSGDKKTGISIIKIDTGLDTGDILRTATLPIKPNDTSASMHEKLARLGSKTLLDFLKNTNIDNVFPQKQNDKLACYAQKLNKQEAKINWNHDAEYIERSIRAFNPWPVSYFNNNHCSIKVWKSSAVKRHTNKPAGTIVQSDKTGIYVATGNGTLVLELLQIPNRKIMKVEDILNSRADWFKISKQLN